MNRKNKIVALLLFAAMLTGSVACTNQTGTPDDTQASNDGTLSETTIRTETTDPTTIPPEATDQYDGMTYRIFNGYSRETKYITTAIYPEEQTGDTIDDALYKRCADTEERLGITLEVTDGELSQIKNSINAGDDFADLTFADLTNVMSLVTQNYCYDFYDVPNIRLEKAWWDQNAEDKLSFEGKLYYTFSDIIFTQTDNARAVFFNKAIAEELKLDNLYELVKSGKWTIDKLREYSLLATSDLNGDTKFDKNDRYGVANWGVTGLGEALLTGCESEIVLQGNDGVPYFNCFTEHFTEVYTKVLDILSKDSISYLQGDAVEMFENNKVLFLVNSLNNTIAMRDMATDFGIIPNPKLDEAQENYQNVSPNAHAMIIPITVQNIDFAGAVTEELAYQSHITLLPAYYDILLKGKVTRDEESLEMLDIIHNNVSYVIKIIGTAFSDSIYTEMSKKNYAIASFLASKQEQVETQLEKVLAQFRD